MRCLYIVAHDPISPNCRGGASAMYYDQLLALSELGHEIHLWHFASAEGRERFNQFVAGEPARWETVQKLCHTVQLSSWRNGETLWGRGLARLRSYLPPGLPVSRWSLHLELQQLIQRLRPELIWAQHLEPAMLAVQQTRVPVVYVHHDWLYRIKALRNNRPVDPRQKHLEERLVSHVAAVVTGSKIEQEEITLIRGPGAYYIPVSYGSVTVATHRVESERQPFLVHLGGMGATASRDGLLAFFESAWPAVSRLGLKFRVVGDTADAPPGLKAHLARVECCGFVSNLVSVLRPFDLNLIPWGHATGQRTRLPVAFNHAQVVVAVRAGVACYPEAQDGVNCRLVDSVAQMPGVIAELAGDAAQRFRLGTAAKRTFESCFVRRALLPRYAEVLTGVAAGKPAKGKVS